MPSFDRSVRQAGSTRGGRRGLSRTPSPAPPSVARLAETPESVLDLQRSIGNAATSSFLQRSADADLDRAGISVQREEEEDELEDEEKL